MGNYMILPAGKIFMLIVESSVDLRRDKLLLDSVCLPDKSGTAALQTLLDSPSVARVNHALFSL